MDDLCEIVYWLKNYAYKKNKPIRIVTIDNPGWAMTVVLETEKTIKEKKLLLKLKELKTIGIILGLKMTNLKVAEDHII